VLYGSLTGSTGGQTKGVVFGAEKTVSKPSCEQGVGRRYGCRRQVDDVRQSTVAKQQKEMGAGTGSNDQRRWRINPPGVAGEKRLAISSYSGRGHMGPRSYFRQYRRQSSFGYEKN
jgi:hypothetical protein